MMHNEIMFFSPAENCNLPRRGESVSVHVSVCWHKIKNFTNFASTCSDDGQDNITRHCAILVWNLFSSKLLIFFAHFACTARA